LHIGLDVLLPLLAKILVSLYLIRHWGRVGFDRVC
jgi:hypothetical protein